MVKRSVRCGSYKRNFHKIEKPNQIIKQSKLFVNLTLHMKNPLDQNNFKYLTAGTWCFDVLSNVKCAKTPKLHRDLTSEKFWQWQFTVKEQETAENYSNRRKYFVGISRFLLAAGRTPESAWVCVQMTQCDPGETPFSRNYRNSSEH